MLTVKIRELFDQSMGIYGSPLISISSAPMSSSGSVKLRYEKWLAVWGNAKDITVDYGISGEHVTRLLNQAAAFRGYPKVARTDNGPEFTSRMFTAWARTIAFDTS